MSTSFKLENMRQIKLAEIPAIKKMISELPARSRPFYNLTHKQNGHGIIAEIKPGSPTMNKTIDVDPVTQAFFYKNGGASAISVLTDSNYFGGSFYSLLECSQSTTLPLLCKEFIYYHEQIDLAALCGADYILLIAKALKNDELINLCNYAKSKNLHPLIEIHSVKELPVVLDLSPEILMINMRNLENLSMDYNTGIETLKNIPQNIIKVSASGIKSEVELKNIKMQADPDYFLIGSQLMNEPNPTEFIRRLLDVC